MPAASKKPKMSPEEQSALFIKTARELGADESEAAFNLKLKKVAQSKASVADTALSPSSKKT